MLVAIPFVVPIGFVLGMALGFDPDDKGGVGPTLEGTEWLRLLLLAAAVAAPFAVGTYLGIRGFCRGDRRKGLAGIVLNAGIALFLAFLTVGGTAIDSLTFEPDQKVGVRVFTGAPTTGQAHIGVADSKYGEILVDRDGNALYTDAFGEDNAWKGELVSCRAEDRCLDDWAIFEATDTVTVHEKVGRAKVGAILRRDGTKQLSYNGFALYKFPGDQPDRFVPFVKKGDEEGAGEIGYGWGVMTIDGNHLPKWE